MMAVSSSRRLRRMLERIRADWLQKRCREVHEIEGFPEHACSSSMSRDPASPVSHHMTVNEEFSLSQRHRTDRK